MDGWRDAARDLGPRAVGPCGRRPETRRAPAGTRARHAAESANAFGHAYVLPEEVLKGDGLATFAKARHPALGRHGEGPIG